MKSDDLKKRIDSLVSHILFDYNGVPCGIDPLSREHIDMWYGQEDHRAKSVDEAMNVPLFDGKSLTQICDSISNVEY